MEISYFDNVKDSVKEQGSEGSAGFDTLREAAEESSEEEQNGDDTEIEILKDGISKSAPGRTQKEKKRENTGSDDTESSGMDDSPADQVSKQSNSVDSSLEEKLDTIIEQNERMIEILESFAE